MKKKKEKKNIEDLLNDFHEDDIALNEHFSNILADLYEHEEEKKGCSVVYESIVKNPKQQKAIYEQNRHTIVRKKNG